MIQKLKEQTLIKCSKPYGMTITGNILMTTNLIELNTSILIMIGKSQENMKI